MKALIGIIVVVLLVGGGYFLLAGNTAQAPIDEMMENDEAMMESDSMVSNDTTTEENGDAMMNDDSGAMMDDGDAMMEKVTVTYTNDGYSPKEVTVKKGQSVTWVNESSRTMWPATARHPTHTVYPNSDIKNCDTAPAGSMFDACKEIPAGESYTFTFNEIGEWGYHDHTNASKTGKVIVTE